MRRVRAELRVDRMDDGDRVLLVGQATKPDKPGTQQEEVWAEIKFQSGPILEHGANGVQIEDIIAVAIERIEKFQEGGFHCEENAAALRGLNAALGYLNERTRRRVDQGVEGRDIAHESADRQGAG